jgi:hypothetical protein
MNAQHLSIDELADAAEGPPAGWRIRVDRSKDLRTRDSLRNRKAAEAVPGGRVTAHSKPRRTQ